MNNFSPEFHRQAAASLRQQAAEHCRQMEIAIAQRVAKRRQMPVWVWEIAIACASRHCISPALLMSESKTREVVTCRNETLYLVKTQRPMASLGRIGGWFGRDSTSVGHALASYQRDHPDLPGLTLRIAAPLVRQSKQEVA